MLGKLRVFLPALLLAAGVPVLAGCTAREEPRQPALERINPDTLSGDVKQWFQQNERKAGTYTLNANGRTYVLVAWGEKPTGGYSVRIEDVGEGSAGMVVAVRLEAPQPGDVVTQAVTYPRDLVAVPESQRTFTFAFLGREAESLLTRPAAPATPPPGEKAATPVAEAKNFRVFAPSPGASVQSPLRVRGQARVFEGAFTLELEDGHNVLATRNVQASAGGPAWGDFDVQLEFAQPTSPAGTLLFVTYSAKDGSRQEELAVPVKFFSYSPPGS